MQFTILRHPGAGQSKAHFLGPVATVFDPSTFAPRRRRVASVTSASEAFWVALSHAKVIYNSQSAAPLPWVATPAKARRLRFLNQHGQLASLKQPAQFQCPPARFWPGGRIPLGIAAPAAAIDETAAQYLARMGSRHDANVATLARIRLCYGAGSGQEAAMLAACKASAAALARAPGAGRMAA